MCDQCGSKTDIIEFKGDTNYNICEECWHEKYVKHNNIDKSTEKYFSDRQRKRQV